jgi:hypothetical protein
VIAAAAMPPSAPGWDRTAAAPGTLQAVSPDRGRPGIVDNVGVLVNGLFVAVGVVANLAFEEIGLDLYVVAVVAVFAVVLVWRQPGQLIHRYYSVAFVLGLAVTLMIKTAG